MANAATEARAIDRAERHGVPGQLNVFVLDVDSYVTSYGRHNKLIASGPQGGEMLIQERITDLPMSTDADRRRVARRDWPGTRHMVHVSSERWEGRTGPCIDHTYRLVR